MTNTCQYADQTHCSDNNYPQDEQDIKPLEVPNHRPYPGEQFYQTNQVDSSMYNHQSSPSESSHRWNGFNHQSWYEEPSFYIWPDEYQWYPHRTCPSSDLYQYQCQLDYQCYINNLEGVVHPKEERMSPGAQCYFDQSDALNSGRYNGNGRLLVI